jgi:site-specific recombinase XerD
VTARILRLKMLTVKVRAGRATRTYKLVKSDGPDDLVFQSVKDGRPMNDQNILKRHLQPAARKLGLPFVNWQCLRTSHATWLVASGADVKSVQSQMRHSRVSTSLEIYAQAIPTAQRRALEQLSVFAGVDTQESRSNSRSKTVQ